MRDRLGISKPSPASLTSIRILRLDVVTRRPRPEGRPRAAIAPGVGPILTK
jgi:hypothetical protein